MTTSVDTYPIAQLRIARQHPTAMAIGVIAGTVPVGTYRLGHSEISSWDPRVDPKALVAYAGLAFSLLTVVSWAASAFATSSRLETAVKAIGFTALVEALMMTSSSAWLSGWCLVLLVAVNAVANGCRLAIRAAAHQTTQAERAAAKPVSAKRRSAPRPRLRAVP